jgi:hypothetical protein
MALCGERHTQPAVRPPNFIPQMGDMNLTLIIIKSDGDNGNKKYQAAPSILFINITHCQRKI